MLMLALESSAKAASAALARDGRLVAQAYQCSGLTHSRTLLPMTEDLLKNCGVRLSDVDAVAVAHGPGSFTGVRIGVATAKGLCWGADKPCAGVSTLEAMAWNGECAGEDAVLCCAMDARRSQVYNALFTFRGGAPRRLCPDRAISLDELGGELETVGKKVFFLGDGAELCYNALSKRIPEAVLAPENIRMQSAWGVCRAAEGKPPRPAGELLPVYLRLSQAERERLQRKKKENDHE